MQPISQFSRSVSVLLAHRDTGIRRLAELEAKVRGGARMAFASTGNATIGPMLIGMEKPVQIATMASTASELVTLAVLAAGGVAR